jgi:hypothetical protein
MTTNAPLMPQAKSKERYMTQANDYRQRAELLRLMGDEDRIPAIRDALIRVAEQYERLARSHEQAEQRQEPAPKVRDGD